MLYGRNAARECLRARRRHVHRVIMAENVKPSAIIKEITTLAQQAKVPVQKTQKKELDKIARGHQGVVLEVGRYPTVELDDILGRAMKQDEPVFIAVLDHIEDPHNLGAILRTAEIVGVHGVVIPKQRAVGITPAVVNASAGAAEHVLVAEVPNVVQTLNKLKEHDVWVAGLEGIPEATRYDKTNLSGNLALVIGSEGQGVSRLVKENCDFLVKLPMRGQIESLNASVAAGLMLYEVWRRRDFE